MSRFAAFLIYLSLCLASLGVGGFAALRYATDSHGVEPRAAAPVLGTNVSLEQYASAADRQHALNLVRGAGLTAVRQHFPWREVESTQGRYDWAKWDEIVDQARAANLQMVAVLDTAPQWAQRDYERDLPEAPPENFADYANFAGAFAKRYSSFIHYYEIWDEPNVHPGWGDRNAEPAEYAQFLHLAAAAIRANDPQAKIVLAGLGMNLETQRSRRDYSEILFLRGLYEAGAQNDFDVVATKPYGMWTGPEDRRTSSGILNFSRVILLHDEMKARGDLQKPLWAVDLGWNALPSGWEGQPSPWGSDAETVQADRLTRGMARARDEWGWIGAMFPLILQPNVPADDPRWGFSLVTRDFQPRASYAALAAFSSNPPPVRRPASAPVFSLVLLGVVAMVSAWRGARYAPLTEIAGWWRAVEKNWFALPEWAQFTLLALAVGAFYLSPNVLLNFVLLALCVPLSALRLDLALVFLVWAIPFWLYPKTLFGNFEMSLVEVLTLASAAAWIWRWLFRYPLRFSPVAARQLSSPGHSLRERFGQLLRPLSSLDWAVLALVLLGLFSTQVAANFGVAMREFRVIVIEPALLYALVRVLPFTHGTDERIGIRESSALIERLINALLLSGLVVCLIGLAQFARGDLIVGAGVQRVRAVWGSPNNAALFLGRLLPVALAFALFWTGTRRRWLYLGMAGLLAVTILLTYSLGALVLGLPASLGFIALWWLWSSRGHLRRQRAVILGLLLFGLLAVILLVGSTRFQTLFVTGTGTGFFRLAVWTSGVNMIRDHPLFGVGLDNFLYEYPKYILPEAWREPNLSHPHNVLLDFWVRLGLLGAVVLVWLQAAFFRRAWHLARTTTDAFTRACVIGLMASMIDFLAHGMIDAAYFVVDLAFVFMLTLGITVNLAASQK